MNTQDFQNLEKQIQYMSVKVDDLYKKIDQIYLDLDVNHGMKMHDQLAQIVDSLKVVTRDLDIGQVSTFKYRIDNVIKSMEVIQDRIDDLR